MEVLPRWLVDLSIVMPSNLAYYFDYNEYKQIVNRLSSQTSPTAC